MPELAEVKRHVDALSAEFGGQDLLAVNVIGGRFLKEPIDHLALLAFPLKNAQFNAKGKFIYWTVEDPACHVDEDNRLYFFITLGMAGSFGKQNKHSAVKFTFSNGEIFYNDIRHFGTIKVVYEGRELKKKLKSLGWDALREPLPTDFVAKVRGKSNHKTISEALLDQSLFAGCGNYLRSEIMYLSGINPNDYIANLSDEDILDLCHNLTKTAQEAYDAGGATIATYTDMYGNAGKYHKQFKVYGQKRDPLGQLVVKYKAKDGRTVHYVPDVQGWVF